MMNLSEQKRFGLDLGGDSFKDIVQILREIGQLFSNAHPSKIKNENTKRF